MQATDNEETKLTRILKDLHGTVDVVTDLCLHQSKEAKEKFIQMIIVEANYLIDACMLIAREEKIEFSFRGMDIQYLGSVKEPTLVHPDTERANDLERKLERTWDSSMGSCEFGDD